jgi:protein-disulfide isomerase|tara:strand:- start:310 stop:1059 length:750 start_codon:yes stop_codon:yes gene_type:complete
MRFSRLFSAAALACAVALPAQALDLQNMTPEERAIFREEVRAYLMDQPQVIMDAVNQLEARQQQQAAQDDLNLVSDNADALFNDGYSYVGGNPDGDITMVEFLDYRCGYCRKAHTEVAKMLATDGNIRLIVKEFPILGEQSVLASRFAMAVKQVAGDEVYKAINDSLMTLPGEISMPTLARLGKTFGLDMALVEDAMNGPDVADQLAQTKALAQKMRITGTPTFVLQDEMLRGYLPYEQMMSIVNDKRS